MSDIQASFDTLEKNIAANKEKATSANAIFAFDLSGDNGGIWKVNLKQDAEAPFVTTGDAEGADVTIAMATSDWIGVVSGKTNPMQAFMMGKIKVKGDMGLAMKLQNILSLAS